VFACTVRLLWLNWYGIWSFFFEGVLGDWCLILSAGKGFHVCACINE